MALDPVKNFAYGIIQTPPFPALSGTSFVLASGQGNGFPDPSVDGVYNLPVQPVGVFPTNLNTEIVRVTARVGDTFTIVRTQEGSSAMQIAVGYQVALCYTKKTRDDIEARLPSALPVPINQGGTNAITAAAARTALGLAIGSAVQAWNALLDIWATITLDTDGTLAANSDTKVASQKAVKTYVDSKALLNRSTSTVAMTNTVVETSIYSFSVPANTLGTNKVLRLKIIGTYLQNSGGAVNLTIKVKYGATIICSSVTSISAGGADPYCFELDALLAAVTANSQKANFNLTGKGAAANTNQLGMAGYGTAAEDSTAPKTLDITITHGSASASLTLTKEAAILELLL